MAITRRHQAPLDRNTLLGLRDNGVTLEEVGQVLGVSKERVRQIEVNALRKCRDWCRRHGYRVEDLVRYM